MLRNKENFLQFIDRLLFLKLVLNDIKKVLCISLMICSTFLMAQNKMKADSISFILHKSKKQLSKKETALLYTDLSFYHPDFEKGLLYAKKALKISENMNDGLLQAEAWDQISRIQRLQGNNSESLESAFNALKFFESIDLKQEIAVSYGRIGVNFLKEKDFLNSIIYFKKSKNTYETIDEFENLPITYLNLGEAYRLNNNTDSAYYYFKKSLGLAQHNNDKLVEYYAFGNLGIIHSKKSELKSAEFNLKESIKGFKTYDDFYPIAAFGAELGKVHLKQNKFKKAEKEFTKALIISKKASLKEQIRDINKLLSNFYSGQKSYKKALYHQKQFQTYQDSLVNKENVKKIEQLKAGYEIDKRETKIGLLNKVNNTQKKWVFSLAIGVATFLVLASLLFLSRKKIRKANTILAIQKEEISKREQEKAWLLRELNHRVKNNLQMVASLLNLQSNKLSGHPAQEAIIIGKQRVEALSLVHRKLYQEGVDTRINIKDYITELVLGLFHAYNAEFKPEIKISDKVSVNIDSAIPLALIVNEIIINCLKYAFQGIENPTLNVEITELPEQRLALHIWDNGVGFDENAEMKDSLGMKIINSLTRQLDGSVTHFNKNGAHWRLNVLGK